MRTILVPHTSGLIDYKGENSRLFNITGSTGDSLICDYSGDSDEQAWPTFVRPTPSQEYRTRVKPGEIIELLKDPDSPEKRSYAKIFRAAYPRGNVLADDVALEFLEQMKYTYSDDGMIDVADIEPALDYFIEAPRLYIDADDKARVMQGCPL